MSRIRTLLCLGALLGALSVLGPAGSAGSPGSPTAVPGTVPGGPCPVEPVKVAVSVDQWSDLVQHLGGQCVDVTTIVAGAAADPHDYEPTPADRAALGGARLIVANGLGYDAWAEAAARAGTGGSSLVTAADAAGAREGDNPHLWYDPGSVERTAAAVTAELRRLLPGADAHLDGRAAAVSGELAGWTGRVAQVRARHRGRAYAATEPVLAPLGDDLGLNDVTPAGYVAAAAGGSDPAPGDLSTFRSALRNRRAEVLVVNTQTAGSVPEQLRAAAEAAGVPVVEVTETVPADQPSFLAWQLDLLERLDRALPATSG